MGDFTLVQGDNLPAMRKMKAGSIDAIATDPPYGLRFMGKRWDYDVPGVETFAEMLRVLKDGGRLLCFAGARTAHRMTVNIEDAGFVIEDVVMWLYGSGFPKHRSKLKPAYEPIVVARKGGASDLNIDAARIGMMTPEEVARSGRSTGTPGYNGGHKPVSWKEGKEPQGRWPANVVLDEEAAEVLDAQSGTSTSEGGSRGRSGFFAGLDAQPDVQPGFGDTGGASRFFYCAKADKAEREAGLEGIGARSKSSMPGRRNPDDMSGFKTDHDVTARFVTEAKNHHPTVKPVDLMRWLVRLVAKPGETVLDPFMGSGTTGVACTLEGVHFIGIEREPEYAEIARLRIGNTQPSLFADPAA